MLNAYNKETQNERTKYQVQIIVDQEYCAQSGRKNLVVAEDFPIVVLAITDIGPKNEIAQQFVVDL